MHPEKISFTATQVAEQYFEAFGRSDLEAIVGLFAPDGKVRSSSGGYVECDPRDFYAKVLGLTADKNITIHSLAIDREDRNTIIVHFGYDWTLTNGTRKNFTNAFDKFEIDPQQEKVKSLTINLGADVLAG